MDATLMITTDNGTFISYTLSEWTIEQSYPSRLEWNIGDPWMLPLLTFSGSVSGMYVIPPKPTVRQRAYKLLMMWKTKMLEHAA